MPTGDATDTKTNARLLALARQLRAMLVKRPDALAHVVAEWLEPTEELER